MGVFSLLQKLLFEVIVEIRVLVLSSFFCLLKVFN